MVTPRGSFLFIQFSFSKPYVTNITAKRTFLTIWNMYFKMHACLYSYIISELNIDDKSAVKAKGLWEDWHMRQAVDQASRVNHRSGERHACINRRDIKFPCAIDKL